MNIVTQWIYSIVQNFDGGNFDFFDAFQPDCQTLTCKIFKASQRLQEKTVTIHQNISHQIFEKSVSIKISPCQNFVLYGMGNYCQVNLWYFCSRNSIDDILTRKKPTIGA